MPLPNCCSGIRSWRWRRERSRGSGKTWFGEIDDVRDGGPDDPRLALILVDADSVTYMKQDKSKPVVLFEIAPLSSYSR
jgi:general stress protein 26